MAAAFLLAAMPAAAKLELPRIFGDGMVIQRDKPVKVWGWGDKGESIAVEFGGQAKKATADGDGNWTLTLKPLSMNATPQELRVKGKKDALVLKNIVIGDVWLCSGQSNMEAAAGGIFESDLDIPRAKHPNIRCLTIPLCSSPTPLDNFPIEERNPYYVELKGVWRTCTPENTRDFPAVGYHFAKVVHETTGVPIGLIDNSWGGSAVETWISRETLSTIPKAVELIEYFDNLAASYDPKVELERRMGNWRRHAEKMKAAGNEPSPKPVVPETYKYTQGFPGGCFNALIAPIQKFSIKGVLFYQGMNNSVGKQANPNLGMKMYSALIPDWRKAFGEKDLPFCMIQMTSWGLPNDVNEPENVMPSKASGTREAQTNAHLQNENTGLVCTYDLGHIQMHSPNKKPIGTRAARWALADVYQVKGIKYIIPMLESWEVEGDRILLSFTKASYPSCIYGARVSPTGFVIAGKDRHFYPAKVVQAEGGKYAASSEFVKEPAAVRYAWGVHPMANFGNRAGPAAPFRTDNWPAWNDSPIINAVVNPEVPTPDDAKRMAWKRKAQQARKVLEEYEAWSKTQK
jgi:sialate O-acetylesterase